LNAYISFPGTWHKSKQEIETEPYLEKGLTWFLGDKDWGFHA